MIDDDPLHAFIRSQMAGRKIEALSIAVVDGEYIEYMFVINASLLAPFQAASLSKPVFAYLVMLLVEEGVLELDRPLTDYVPDPIMTDERLPQITARHLLTHTGGFPCWCETETLYLEAAPGHRFTYSGEGFTYLQKAVEQVTGQPLYDLAQARVFEPLGMVHSSFAWGLRDDGSFHVDDDNNVLPIGDHRKYANAAFSLLTTASDYALFLREMLHPQLLPPATRNLILQPIVQAGDYPLLSWGLGWGIQQTAAGPAFFHWGGAQNRFTNYTVGFPDQDKALVLLTRSREGLDVAEAIARRALAIDVPHPAFEWLLPLIAWRPDARR